MADYTPDELNNGTTSSVDLTAGSTNTFTFTTEAVNSYFTLETTRNSDGKYDNTITPLLSGSFENFVNVISSITSSDFFNGFILGEGTSSFDFIPSEEITGALFNLRTAGSIYLSLVGGGGVDPLWNGLLAYYTADSTPNDALGNYNGTLTNGATYGTGIINQGFSLDGVNDYVNLGNNLDFDGSTPFSISTWVKLSTINKLNTVYSKTVKSTAQGYFLRFQETNKLRFSLGGTPFGNALYIETVNTYTNNVWYNVVITYDGSRNTSGINLYINNNSQTFNSLYNNLTSSTSNSINFVLGSLYSDSFFMSGIQDEVGIWNRELTPSEVTELYNGGSALQYPN